MTEEQFFSTTEVAEITGLTVDAVGARARRGSILSRRDEVGRIFIPASEAFRLRDEIAYRAAEESQGTFTNEGDVLAPVRLGRDPLSVSKAILEGNFDPDDERSEIVALRAQNAEYRRVLNALNKRETLNERIVNEIREGIQNFPYQPTINFPKSHSGSSNEGLEMVLAVSDAHFPEVVNPEEALGVSYGPEICRRRIEYLLDRTARLAELRGGVSKITVAVLGDMIGGNIHEELEVTNAMTVSEATVSMAYMLYDFVIGLRQVVPKVDVVVMPGNHARLTKKPRAKLKFDNYEFIMGEFLKGIVGDTDGVNVAVPKSLIYTHKVFDFNIGLFHGDGSKASSFAGIPFYGLKQRSNATQAMFSQLGHPRLDMLLMGHYHKLSTWTEGDCHIVINGAIKGGDEYSISGLSSVSPAVQALLTFDRKRGWISTERIELEHIV